MYLHVHVNIKRKTRYYTFAWDVSLNRVPETFTPGWTDNKEVTQEENSMVNAAVAITK